MKQLKRITAFLLVVCMIIGILPANLALNAKAAEDTIYILAGGDFQEAGDHTESAENVTNILAQIGQKYTTMDGFLFIGDYDCETHNNMAETANGITALMGAVRGKYSNLTDANSVLVQGNHDYMDSRIDATGGHKFDGYSAYVLNEDDYPNGGGTESGIQTLANNLKTWLDTKINEAYDEPIFIVSHLPLAFSPRTVTQGDAKYAKYIFDVLNDASANGLNIIFMHGHDHAYGPDNYMGGEAIYLPEGDKINIAETGSTSKWTEETLNFTYMNAGYTGYYSDAFDYNTTAGTDKLTMTVFAITDNEVTVERYSANGLYNLKSAGYDGSYSDTSVKASSLGLTYNSTVYASPQTIALSSVSTEDEAIGTIGEWVEVPGEITDDVSVSGNDWVTITAPVGGTTTYTYTQADSITAGEKYVIVGNRNDVALMDNNGSMASQSVTISETTMTSTTELTEWTFSGSSSGTIYNGTRYLCYSYNSCSLSTTPNTSFTITDNGSNFRIRSGNRSFYYDGSAWTRSYAAQYVRLYQLKQTTTTGGTDGLYGKLDGELTYTVAPGTTAADALAVVKSGITIKYATAADYSDEATHADDGEGMSWTLDSSYDGDTPGDYAVTISYNGTVIGTAEVIVPAASTYYIAEGNGLYTVDMGTTATDALATVQEGITVSSATDSNGANKTAIDDSAVTWKWVDTYDGKNAGPYTVEVLYDGTSLGTVEVKVNVHYDSYITDNWASAGTQASGYKYVLDTDGIEYGSDNKYIIVAADQALALHATSSSNGTAESITISGTTATTTTRDYEYHFVQTSYNRTRYELITKGDGSQYLYQEGNGVRYGTRSSVKFQVNHHGSGVYDIHDIDGTNWYIIYSGGWTVTETTSARVRLYKYEGGLTGGNVYAKLEGNTTYTVTQGSSATKALNTVKAGITGYISNNADGSNATELADSDLTWTWLNTYKGQTVGSYWVEISYNGKVLGVVEVKVKPGVVNNYPEYPNEGAVKVNKTATGIDFQSSGIAQVELSASGVPVKKGADVILMLDTSSSMTSHTVTGTSKTRAEVLEDSLADLITQFKTPGDDGELLDIRVAIADFNGFYGENQSASGTAYDRDAADMMSDDISYNAASQAKVYTGDGTLGAGAFIDAADLANTYTLNYTSGTNYDYAMDAIYQLGTAIKESNGEEDRDLYVIFMSDGAAMQWNYYHSQGASSLWNKWITGAWTTNNLTTANLNCTTHAYYYNEVDTDGDGMLNEHRMANAIKGSSTELYEVIRKTSGLGTATEEANMYMVPGLDATMFAISFDAQADTNVTEESMDKSIETLASEQTSTTRYYYKVTSADELTQAFNVIGNEIAYAATNARFVDQLGDDFDLQIKTSTYTVIEGNTTVAKTLAPVIEVLSYDIYTRQDYLNGTITADKIGDRKGTSTLQEVVKFSDDGTQAYSNKIDVDKDGNYGVTVNADGTYTINDTDDNIFGEDGVIYASTFAYNTGVNSVWLDVDVDSTTGTEGKEYELTSETFYWKMGTITTTELALRYYVYLEGSMEGTAAAGSYATNEYATLYYDNYLGNECEKGTVSPTLAWKSANVSYAFYLVDKNGNIIVNQTTGQTGSFANKIAVTNPVVYEEILLNNTDQVQSIDVAAISDDVLPKYYTLYDEQAVYEVTINSNSTGAWNITKGDVNVASTYVTQYKTDDASAYSNALTNVTIGDDYTHTIVWFAVVWTVQAHPDSVVIDYGLPVDISVLTNDMFGEYGKLAGVGAYTEGLENTTAGASLQTGFGNSYTGTYGSATADTTTGKLRYELNKSNGMQMQTYEKFAYAVNYSGNENAGYYYDTVTVIPATSIYYEEDYVTLESYTWNNGWTQKDTSLWSKAGTKVNGTQDEDRPGKYSLTDANNIYGYDSVNLNMSTYSMGSAWKATVDYDNKAEASFEFYGTGFDVISMTDSDTGMMYVDVYKENGVNVKSFLVDTYYGYTKNDAGEWVVDPQSTDSIYQVPVIKIDGLEYGKYKAVIQAVYEPIYDHVENSSGYNFYLDAIRIYDPANNGVADGTTDTTIEDAYKADGEGWPSYIELRNQIIAANSFDKDANNVLPDDLKMRGLVFIDGNARVDSEQIVDYQNYGPNNEVYIAPGQRIAFMLSANDNIENVHIGIKSADGATGTYTITNIAQKEDTENNIAAGTYYGAKTSTINTTTDMYYDLTDWKDDIIVISNTGDRYNTEGVISVTNIKLTYTSNPYATSETGEVLDDGEAGVYMTRSAAMLTLRALNTPVEDVTPEVNTPENSETGENVSDNTGATETVKTEDSEVSATVKTEDSEASETVKTEDSETGETVSEGTEVVESEDMGSDESVSENLETELEDNMFTRFIEFIEKLFSWLFGWLLG